jgi:hypothetical protein
MELLGAGSDSRQVPSALCFLSLIADRGCPTRASPRRQRLWIGWLAQRTFEPVRNAERAQAMNRTRGSADFHADPIASILHDPFEQSIAAQIIGQAYVIALNLVLTNKAAVDAVATCLAEKRELYGDELLELLDANSW